MAVRVKKLFLSGALSLLLDQDNHRYILSIPMHYKSISPGAGINHAFLFDNGSG